MSKKKTTANAEEVVLSVNERILRDVQTLYTDEKDGLLKLAKELDLELQMPRKKINVLLIGNHSAGKSSFINWYIEETIQRTGVAIETQGFTLVTSGKIRESLMATATMHLFPFLKSVNSIDKINDYVTTEVSSSKQKNFNLITFIDTPGLVDGEMNYPFDVDRAILCFSEAADLIFVFIDPIGQALCKRTLNIVDKLSEVNGSKMHFFLSKADEAGTETDRQKVMMQIVQELCKRPSLNKAGFDMLTIYIPSLQEKKTRCVNQIEEVCLIIEKTIKQAVQNALNSLEKDTEVVATHINNLVRKDSETRSVNLKRQLKSSFFGLLSILIISSMIASLMPQALLRGYLGDQVYTMLDTTLIEFHDILEPMLNLQSRWHYLGVIVGVGLLFMLLSLWYSKKRPTMSKKLKNHLIERKDYVQNHIKNKKKRLYEEYLKQSIVDVSM